MEEENMAGRIKRLRKANKLTLEELATRIGVKSPRYKNTKMVAFKTSPEQELKEWRQYLM